jgi:hypothetical protein
MKLYAVEDAYGSAHVEDVEFFTDKKPAYQFMIDECNRRVILALMRHYSHSPDWLFPVVPDEGAIYTVYTNEDVR